MENTEVEKKEEKDTKSKVKLALTIVGNVLFYAVIIVLFLFSLMNINAGNGEKSFPNLFGRGMLSVSTNSMERNENGYHQEVWSTYSIQEINAGDLVHVKVFKESDFSSLKVGDVITFVDESLAGKDTMLNTHRIVYIGNDYVICQGDYVVTTATTDEYAFKLDAADPLLDNAEVIDAYCQTIQIGNIKGIVTSVTRGAGTVLSNIRANWLWIFVLPVAVILVIEIFFVFKNILDLRNEKNKAKLATDKETMMADLEAEKEKMRQELLAEMRAQMAAEMKGTAPSESEPEVKEEPKPESEEPVVEEASNASVAEETENEVKAEEAVEPVTEENVEEVAEEVKEEVPEEPATEEVKDTEVEPENKEE